MAMLSYVLAVFHFSCIFNYSCCLKSVLSMLVLSQLFKGWLYLFLSLAW